jgi:hypothetical protein
MLTTSTFANHFLVITGLDQVRGPFEKFVDWRQCSAVMQREVVAVLPSCSGGGNVVAAFSSL